MIDQFYLLVLLFQEVRALPLTFCLLVHYLTKVTYQI